MQIHLLTQFDSPGFFVSRFSFRIVCIDDDTKSNRIPFSFSDIVEDDRSATHYFQPKRVGIRNYKPKILLDEPILRSTSTASLTAGADHNELDVWV